MPNNAVAEDERGQFVFVVTGARADRRSVTTGERLGTRVRILTGLDSGERVVAGLSPELLADLQAGGRVAVVN